MKKQDRESIRKWIVYLKELIKEERAAWRKHIEEARVHSENVKVFRKRIKMYQKELEE